MNQNKERISEQSSMSNFVLNTFIPRLSRVLGSKPLAINENPRKMYRFHPPHPKKNLLPFSSVYFFVQGLWWRLRLVLPLSTPWMSVGKVRRPVWFVERVWCFCPLKGPSDIFLFLMQPREFANREVGTRRWVEISSDAYISALLSTKAFFIVIFIFMKNIAYLQSGINLLSSIHCDCFLIHSISHRERRYICVVFQHQISYVWLISFSQPVHRSIVSTVTVNKISYRF